MGTVLEDSKLLTARIGAVPTTDLHKSERYETRVIPGESMTSQGTRDVPPTDNKYIATPRTRSYR